MSKQSEVVDLYGGDHTIEYDDEAHSYKHVQKGVYIDGCTSVLKVLDKSEFLVPWAAKMAAEGYSQAVKDWLAEEKDKPGALTWRAYFAATGSFEKRAKAQWRETRDAAGGVGTIAHDYAQDKMLGQENLLALADDDPEVKKAVAAVDEFFGQHEFDPVFVERIMFSPKHWVAGRCDWIGTIDGGPLAVNDYKVSKRFYMDRPYLSYALQFGGYALMYEEEFGEPIDFANLIRLDRKTGKPHIHTIKLTKDIKDAFLFCRGLEQTISRIKKDGQVG